MSITANVDYKVPDRSKIPADCIQFVFIRREKPKYKTVTFPARLLTKAKFAEIIEVVLDFQATEICFQAFDHKRGQGFQSCTSAVTQGLESMPSDVRIAIAVAMQESANAGFRNSGVYSVFNEAWTNSYLEEKTYNK